MYCGVCRVGEVYGSCMGTYIQGGLKSTLSCTREWGVADIKLEFWGMKLYGQARNTIESF